jgi:hypothetical protein
MQGLSFQVLVYVHYSRCAFCEFCPVPKSRVQIVRATLNGAEDVSKSFRTGRMERELQMV